MACRIFLKVIFKGTKSLSLRAEEGFKNDLIRVFSFIKIFDVIKRLYLRLKNTCSFEILVTVVKILCVMI